MTGRPSSVVQVANAAVSLEQKASMVSHAWTAAGVNKPEMKSQLSQLQAICVHTDQLLRGTRHAWTEQIPGVDAIKALALGIKDANTVCDSMYNDVGEQSSKYTALLETVNASLKGMLDEIKDSLMQLQQ